MLEYVNFFHFVFVFVFVSSDKGVPKHRNYFLPGFVACCLCVNVYEWVNASDENENARHHLFFQIFFPLQEFRHASRSFQFLLICRYAV
jgi:hypothetical protein